jgi:ribosome biogenesis GTPase / thiamine phosphate phosphatase
MPGVAHRNPDDDITMLSPPDFERLNALGLTTALAHRAMACAAESEPAAQALQLGRVTEVHRETLTLHDGQQSLSVRAMPRLTRALDVEGTALAAGDWVLSACDELGQTWIHHRVPPTNHIARRDGDGRRHPVVSNVDIALLVMGLDDDFNLRRLERFLSLVLANGVQPVIVLTKADVVADARALYARMQAARSRAPAGSEVVALDARDPDAAQCLKPFLQRGHTLVMLGSSGAGKSTLANTLLGSATQDTGAVREHDSRGKHTTTTRTLLQLPGGACVIDTPGVRTLRPDTDEDQLTASFADIAELAGHCRFRNCTHGQEPGCAVREGIEDDRLGNYQKLLREVRRDSLSALDRQRQVAQWKARGRAARARARDKRGGD